MNDIYLRDLSDSIRAEYERDIRQNRPDLIALLEEGEDIVVGQGYNAPEYGLVN